MTDWRHSLACAAQDGRECTCKCKCTCTHYGRGLSETRVVAPTCPVHGISVKP